MITPLSIAILWTVVFACERAVDLLELQVAEKPLPKELWDFQTEAEHQKAYDYLRDRMRLSWFREGAFLAAFLAFLFGGGFAWAAHFGERTPAHPFLYTFAFVAVLSLLQLLLSTPFNAYSTFVIEARYGFNRTTPKTFALDILKGILVGAIVGGAVLGFAVWILGRFQSNAWFWVWAGYTAIQLFLVWIAPVTILPLFLKLSALPEGALRSAIEAYAAKQKFALDGAWLCDASKRSAKSNAFFTGFGKFRRLVLFDTLVEKHPEAEIVGVVAHEAGHFKLGHIVRGVVFAVLSSFATLWIVGKLIDEPSLYTAFGIATTIRGVGLVLAFFVIGKVMFFLSPIGSYFSRKHEYEADAFAVATTGEKEPLKSALKRLSKDNLAILVHHPLHTAIHASHPPLVERLRAIDGIKS